MRPLVVAGERPQIVQHRPKHFSSAANERWLSPISLLEISVLKVRLGKLPLPAPYSVLFPAESLANDIHLLPLEPDHIEPLTMLPFHHKDPFDRLIVATALVEGLTLVSADSVFDAYGVTRLWRESASSVFDQDNFLRFVPRKDPGELQMGRVVVSAVVESLEDLYRVHRGELGRRQVRRGRGYGRSGGYRRDWLSLPCRLIEQLGLLPIRTRRAVTTAGIRDVPTFGAVR